MTKNTTIKEVKRDSLKLIYNGEKIKINISKELAINEQTINSQLKEAPSSYAFLLLLRSKALKERDKLERAKELAYSEAYIYYKDSNISGMTNEKASHKANTNKKYISLYEQWLEACDKANKLNDICKAFESRDRILQTLSANLRKER